MGTGYEACLRCPTAIRASLAAEPWRQATPLDPHRLEKVPNGKHGDNPLSDFAIHGKHPFPSDIEDLLRQIDTIGRRSDRWPLGENWPFSPREFEWERGKDLDAARRDLSHLLRMLHEGRGDEVLVDPLTRRQLRR